VVSGLFIKNAGEKLAPTAILPFTKTLTYSG
jgi:hypothetical protein